MGLRQIESTLPPGFRFYPSDEELICYYLQKKVMNETLSGGTLMVEVDLHIHEPWELPDMAKLSANEWYFFSFRDRKYATGLRTNRATKTGYWKATGKDRMICNPSSHLIEGMRKTLVFYQGRAPNGVKTNWVMHEFRLENPNSPPKEDWVLCRVFYKKKGTDESSSSSYTDHHYSGSATCTAEADCIDSNTGIDHDQANPFNGFNTNNEHLIMINSSAAYDNNIPMTNYMGLLQFDTLPDLSLLETMDGNVNHERDATADCSMFLLNNMGSVENQDLLGGVNYKF